jgi:uncharacterized membrane protein YbaN (DUF454 family)
MNVQPVWLAGLIGALSPYITTWLARPSLSRRTKSLIAISVAIAIGFLVTVINHQFDVTHVIESCVTAFAAAQIVYDQIQKPTH